MNHHPLAKLFKEQARQSYDRADKLLTVYEKDLSVCIFNDIFNDGPEVTLLERLLSQKINEIAERFPDKPHLHLNTASFFGLCAEYSTEYPEITRKMCVELAKDKIGIDFGKGVSKLDDTIWELAKIFTPVIRKLRSSLES